MEAPMTLSAPEAAVWPCSLHNIDGNDDPELRELLDGSSTGSPEGGRGSSGPGVYRRQGGYNHDILDLIRCVSSALEREE